MRGGVECGVVDDASKELARLLANGRSTHFLFNVVLS
jgi:hypothetical protein